MVKTVRGPLVELPPHADHCATASELAALVARLREEQPDRILVADLFSGAGGLSLGLDQAGLTTVFAVDHDSYAIRTHAHHFPGMSVDWDLADPVQVKRTGELLRSLDIDIIAGGPPCQPFSKAGRSMMRHLVREGARDAHDARRDLWRSYLEIIRLAQPRAVLMENVPDMALDREMFILRSMVFELESWGYSVEEKVVETRDYGVPQFRQRLILVAMAGGVAFQFPKGAQDYRPSVASAISDLPPVEGGARPSGGAEGYWEYDPSGEVSEFARMMRDGVNPEHSDRIYDHITRPVRPDDEQAFLAMDASTRYSELDPKFKRYRDDIFDDKYKRLDANSVSRTITAHIAKDGYWYIHPDQPRTITVREAARIQTFPDWFRFAGPPSAAFRQIGNAVPPMLGRHLGTALIAHLQEPRPAGLSTEQVAGELSGFFRTEKSRILEGRPGVAVPWLASPSRWLALLGEMVLERISYRDQAQAWASLRRYSTPMSVIADRDGFLARTRVLGREPRGQRIVELATLLEDEDHDLTDGGLTRLVAAGVVTQAQADLAMLVASEGDPDECEEPVLITRGTLRVVSRLLSSGPADDLTSRNRLTDGRIAVSSVIGYGDHAKDAHLALMEIAGRYCHSDPNCADCPMRKTCASSQAGVQTASMLDVSI